MFYNYKTLKMLPKSRKSTGGALLIDVFFGWNVTRDSTTFFREVPKITHSENTNFFTFAQKVFL